MFTMDSKHVKCAEATSHDSGVIHNTTASIQEAEAELAATDHQQRAGASLKHKIDGRLMTLLCITYALQSIDKTTLGYAAVFGLKTDLDLGDAEYSWLGALFYLGYLAWEFPTNVLLQRLPINLFMALTVSIWMYIHHMIIVISKI